MSSPLTSPVTSPINSPTPPQRTVTITTSTSTSTLNRFSYSDTLLQTPKPRNELAELPPLDLSPDLLYSSPIVGTAAERKEKRLAKGQKKRAQTNVAKAAEKELNEAREAKRRQEHARTTFRECLVYLRKHGFTFGDLCMYYFNPDSAEGVVRWHEFAAVQGCITRLLDWWSHARSDLVRSEIHDWAVDYVCAEVGKSAHHITRLGLLRTHDELIDQTFVSSFSFDKLHQHFSKEGGIILRVFEAVSKSSAHANTFGNTRKARGQMVTTSAIAACLREHNLGNNLSQCMMGLYLYASGVQRQNFTVLSQLGICTSYTDLIRNDKAEEKTPETTDLANITNTPATLTPNNITPPPTSVNHPTSSEPHVVQSGTCGTSVANVLHSSQSNTRPKKGRLGLIRLLSNGMRVQARTVALIGLFGEVYDNINFMNRTAEQIIGRHDNQENGTCITIFKLWAARLENMETSVLKAAFDGARPLRIEDIVHTESEQHFFHECLIHVVIRIIIKFSRQEKIAALQRVTDQKQPRSSFIIEPHKTEIYPVDAFDIDESSITGNAHADEAVVDVLELRKRTERFWERVRFIAGDQLSIARLRAIENIRAGQESRYEGFAWGIWIPGLFHTKMADINGIFTIHFGNPTARASNPASLAFHNTALHRLPITPTSLPSFRVCRDLLFVSLYARILHCLLLVSGKASLEDYAQSEGLSYETVYQDAAKILDSHCKSSIVEELRQEREISGGRGSGGGDMVYENAVLFLRDSLISREFTDAVQAGDLGRVVLVLKVWALSFRGNGRTKYAYEMLHLIHNIEVVWPEEMKKIVLNNWLVNTTGGKKRFLELDLLQEHLNYWIKVFYKAHGSNMSWDWLSMITPCIDVLQSLARTMNSVLGSDQGLRHAEADIGNDIDTLMSSLAGWHVYTLPRGREVDEDDEIVVDAVSSGLASLTTGTDNPLVEYNTSFSRLQHRRCMAPVDLEDTETPVGPPRTPSPSNSTTSNSNPPSHPDVPFTSPDFVSVMPPVSSPIPDVPGLEEVVTESDRNDYNIGELDEILADVERGVRDPMLSLLTAEDVDLEMEDAVGSEDDIDGDYSDDEEFFGDLECAEDH